MWACHVTPRPDAARPCTPGSVRSCSSCWARASMSDATSGTTPETRRPPRWPSRKTRRTPRPRARGGDDRAGSRGRRRSALLGPPPEPEFVPVERLVITGATVLSASSRMPRTLDRPDPRGHVGPRRGAHRPFRRLKRLPALAGRRRGHGEGRFVVAALDRSWFDDGESRMFDWLEEDVSWMPRLAGVGIVAFPRTWSTLLRDAASSTGSTDARFPQPSRSASTPRPWRPGRGDRARRLDVADRRPRTVDSRSHRRRRRSVRDPRRPV